MSDIVTWLRKTADLYDQQGLRGDFEFGCNLSKAATEIERLKTRIAELEDALLKINQLYYPAPAGIQRIAKQALKETADEQGEVK